jgi:hypothetical protein
MEQFINQLDAIIDKLEKGDKYSYQVECLKILKQTKERLWDAFESQCKCNNVFGPEDSKGECDCSWEIEVLDPCVSKEDSQRCMCDDERHDTFNEDSLKD